MGRDEFCEEDRQGQGCSCAGYTSLPEVVGNAGLLIDPTDPEGLLRALEQVNDEGVRKELVHRGLDRAKTFSWERTATRLAEVVMEN
jgi:glycosyltransferase involved in cell wall biosynthesis